MIVAESQRHHNSLLFRRADWLPAASAGNPTGELMSRHMGIKKIAFTGSTAIGHRIVEASAQSNLKKVTLELGGKSAMIICKDANLQEAAIACHVGLFINMGQCCCASSRIYIHEDVHDSFVEKVS